jgi:hypothetical protein
MVMAKFPQARAFPPEALEGIFLLRIVPSVGLTERERGLTEGLRSYQPWVSLLSGSSVSRGPCAAAFH